MTRTVDLRVDNDAGGVAVVRDTLDDLGGEFGIPARALMQVQVALDEIVSNVVKYAWEDDGRHQFLVRITIGSDSLDLEIIDDGREFDPLTAPAPPPPSGGKLPKPGGLGIHMVKKLVDRLAYQRIDGRNHTTLSKICRVGAAVRGSET